MNDTMDNMKNNITNNQELSKYLGIGSRCAAMLFGAMAMLIFMSEELYLENEMYPYVAQILAVVSFLLLYLFEHFKERFV
jgi:hypothetical protein